MAEIEIHDTSRRLRAEQQVLAGQLDARKQLERRVRQQAGQRTRLEVRPAASSATAAEHTAAGPTSPPSHPPTPRHTLSTRNF